MSRPSSRGVLRPDRLPDFTRLPASGVAANWVRWYWISQWALPDGVTSDQNVIAFPALNVVVQSDVVTVSGATTRASTRTLVGTGWAVGALMRPAAVDWLGVTPATLVDDVVEVDLAALADAVRGAMEPVPDVAAAAAAFSERLADDADPPTEEALIADRVLDLVETDPSIVTVDRLAATVGLSARTVQRLALRYTGVTPLTLIRRRRIQEAAERVRTEPSTSLADIAADTGFTDHAHLTREFSRILGFTPSAYRTQP